MQALELKKGFYWTGILDPNLRIFDIIMETEFGTTYNSYVLTGSEKVALFETAKLKFYDEYIKILTEIVDVGKIDYIIVDHTEPDHAGSIENLIGLNPDIVVVGTTSAINFLKQIINKDFKSLIVKENDTLSLGNKTLRFMALPNLHWPDTMFTYIEEDKVLVTCDSFGAHYSHEGILRSKVTDEEGYLRAAKYYFDNIIGPFKQPFMLNALNRIKDLDIDMICTGHGPVLDSHVDEIIKLYTEWTSVKNPNTKKTVIIPYVSAYGYTKQLADYIEKGIKAAGDIDVKSFDMVVTDKGQVLNEITFADGVLFGTPTMVGEALYPIYDLTISMFAQIHGGKLASAFGSYGWSGEGVPHIIERLKQLRLKVIDGYRIRLKPSESELKGAYDFGYNFGLNLLGKENETKEGKKKLVKCPICGKVFEEGPKNCPVCGAPSEFFKPVTE